MLECRVEGACLQVKALDLENYDCLRAFGPYLYCPQIIS